MVEKAPKALGRGIVVCIAGLTLLAVACSRDRPNEGGAMTEPIAQDAEPTEIQGEVLDHQDFSLNRGDLLHVEAEQQGVDFVLQLRSPSGKVLEVVDSPNGTTGPEELFTIVPTAGLYRLEVVAPRGGVAGPIEFPRRLHRPANAMDRARLEAEALLRKGARLQESQPDQALGAFQQALAVFREQGVPAREAAVLEGILHLHRAGKKWPAALEACESAAAIYRRQEATLQLAAVLQEAGRLYLTTGEPSLAVDRLEEARPLFELHGHTRGTALVLSLLGTATQRQGQPRRALRYLEQALALARQEHDERAEANALSTTAALLSTLNRPSEAQQAYRQAEEIYRRANDVRNLAVVLKGQAETALLRGELAAARLAIEEAETLLRQRPADRDLALVLNTRAIVLRRVGDLDGARQTLLEALALTRMVSDPLTEGVILLVLGDLETRRNTPLAGLERHRQAIQIFEEVGDPRGVASGRARGAEALRSLDRFEEAWRLLEPALSTVEALRADTPRQDIRMDYFAFRQDYYALALDLLWELHRRAPQAGYDAVAFGVRERRAARELRRQIGMQALPASPVQDAGLVDDLRRLADQYRIDGNRTGERVDGEQQQALESLLARWYRAQEPPATSSTLAPVATSPRALTADSLLLAYALGEERSYLWVLSAETQEWVALPGRREIEALAEDFGREILNLRQRRQDRRVKLGRQLSGLLLAPVAGHLRNQRLVLILDGALAAVPFAALPLPGDPSADNDAETFLIERHEIVSLPSLGILEALRRRAEARPPLRGYAVFADPVFDPRDDRLGDGSGEIASSTEGPWAELQRSEEALGASYRQRLEGTAQEAKAIAAITGLSTLMVTGLEARRETLLEKAPAGFAVLHLATHALLHPEAELSGVVLSLVDAAGHPQDGFVRAFEISQLSLPADLVVLSACETGLGEQIPGEGTLSLTWAFLNAGATRVIDSLWRVSDQRSADLMEFFYRAHVQRGLSPTAALQDAQRQMLARPGSLPYDWAGFRLQGDWRPIENPE